VDHDELVLILTVILMGSFVLGRRLSRCATRAAAARVRPVRARVTTDNERAQLWPEFMAFYPGYDFFQRIAKGEGCQNGVHAALGIRG
jgi:hypothetical protein